MNRTELERARSDLLRRRVEIVEAGRRAGAELAALAGTDPEREVEAHAQVDHEASTLATLADAERREVERIDAALLRITEGRYGACGLCGEPIEARRLEVLPWAVTCAGCAERRERERGRS